MLYWGICVDILCKPYNAGRLMQPRTQASVSHYRCFSAVDVAVASALTSEMSAGKMSSFSEAPEGDPKKGEKVSSMHRI